MKEEKFKTEIPEDYPPYTIEEKFEDEFDLDYILLIKQKFKVTQAQAVMIYIKNRNYQFLTETDAIFEDHFRTIIDLLKSIGKKL